jgi:hypothetical protein
MELDVDDIGSNSKNMVELDEPQLVERLPLEIISIVTTRMEAPRGLGDQELLTSDPNEVAEALGQSGTIVFVPDCDRVTYKEAKALYESAAREMSRIYRRMIAEGVKIYVNNKELEPFDPTYWMKESRHTKVEGLEDLPKRSQLVETWSAEIPVEEGSKTTGGVTIKLYLLPEQWHALPGVVQRRQLRVFDDHQVSYLRNGREVSIGPCAPLNLKRHATTHWLSLQIEFNGELDEAFGVAMTKQGVRPKAYALKIIDTKIAEAVTKIRSKIAEVQARNNRAKTVASQSRGEQLARDADPLQRKPLPVNEEEREALEANLKALAITLKRNEENDEQAFERIKSSTYIIQLKHDEFWPFYAVDYQYGKVILTVNTAHPFYTKLYRPLEDLTASEPDEDNGPSSTTSRDGELLVALQMLLFSLARTQSSMTHGNDRDAYRDLFKAFQTEWSDNLKTQLMID